jgi:hypothetical protein
MSRTRWRQLAWVLTILDYAIVVWLLTHGGKTSLMLIPSGIVLAILALSNPRGFVLWAFDNRTGFFWANAVPFYLPLMMVAAGVFSRAFNQTNLAYFLSLPLALLIVGPLHLFGVRPLAMRMARRTRFRSDGRGAAGHPPAVRQRKFYIFPNERFITPSNRRRRRGWLWRQTK